MHSRITGFSIQSQLQSSMKYVHVRSHTFLGLFSSVRNTAKKENVEEDLNYVYFLGHESILNRLISIVLRGCNAAFLVFLLNTLVCNHDEFLLNS